MLIELNIVSLILILKHSTLSSLFVVVAMYTENPRKYLVELFSLSEEQNIMKKKMYAKYKT